MKSIRLPNDVYQRAAQLAEADHVSVDRLVAALVNEGVGDWKGNRLALNEAHWRS
jgi:predicted DNA-binding ribbon-helix-helix protein